MQFILSFSYIFSNLSCPEQITSCHSPISALLPSLTRWEQWLTNFNCRRLRLSILYSTSPSSNERWGPNSQVSTTLPPSSVQFQVPQAILQRRTVARGDKNISQVLIRWSSWPVSISTWEDELELRRQFPAAPAWGQAGTHGGGGVMDTAPTAGSTGPNNARLVRNRKPSSRFLRHTMAAQLEGPSGGVVSKLNRGDRGGGRQEVQTLWPASSGGVGGDLRIPSLPGLFYISFASDFVL